MALASGSLGGRQRLGLAVYSSTGSIGSLFRLCRMVNKMDKVFTLLNMGVKPKTNYLL